MSDKRTHLLQPEPRLTLQPDHFSGLTDNQLADYLLRHIPIDTKDGPLAMEAGRAINETIDRLRKQKR